MTIAATPDETTDETTDVAAAARPGRACPLSYHYGAAALSRPHDFDADAIYVVGGLYGNPFALAAACELAAREPRSRLVFNGDFNWFNVDDDLFRDINAAVLAHHALRGNVETELAMPDGAAGCGCGYPDHVAEDDVARSNAIMARLADTAAHHPMIGARLAALPMHLVARIGTTRIGIVHGDADGLAGWGFDGRALARGDAAAKFRAANVRVFASTHTCTAAAQVFDTPIGSAAVFNNGAAGMPNFAGATCGLVTRIAVEPAPAGLQVFYGARVADLHVDAVALAYDHAGWLRLFDRLWPAGSPAALSYRSRIAAGPAHTPGVAARAGIRIGAPVATAAAEAAS
ncbi:MAG: hypothetical protein JNM90_07135 [Burkholderiales bacterium]|nr:hypothetical protein [Burkholderiales bacterium]